MVNAAVALAALPNDLTGGAVAIGNFDGVHRGHQAVLGAALAAGRPAVALTFEPHPRTFFSGEPVFRLTPAAEKAEAIAALGLDATVVAPFADVAPLSAETFVKTVLAGQLAARQVAVGYDFRFGADRAGDAALLVEAGAAHGFDVTVVEAVDDGDGAAYSSSRIREALGAGALDVAEAMLGYRYRVAAEVMHGEKRGRQMGYPTANQALAAANGLRHGIYAVRTRIDGAWRDGVASFGRRPTFDNGRPLLETFVFDWTGDLYGMTMPVIFVAFLRPEMKFEGMDALVAQMDADSRAARAALAKLEPLTPLDAALNFR